MYVSFRTVLVRNLAVAIVNGCITLIILLIAPLGLMAVLTNTFLVMVTTYIVGFAADRVLLFLQRGNEANTLHRSRQTPVDLRSSAQLRRRR